MRGRKQRRDEFADCFRLLLWSAVLTDTRWYPGSSLLLIIILHFQFNMLKAKLRKCEMKHLTHAV